LPVRKGSRLTNRSPGALTAADLQSVILRWLTLVTGTIVARRFIVRGRVQGVGFRWFVEREAHILGIAGWVRNNADSSVEVLAQGTKEQLVGLRSRLREGPRAARVDDVEEFESQPISEMNTFRIEGAW
jgi:acylphosphatase